MTASLFAVIVKEQLTRQGKREKGGDLITEMHASKDQLSVETMGDYEGRMTQFGEYYVNFESIPAGFPPGGEKAFKGLHDDACQCPHWGYVFKGKFKLLYTDGHEEIVSAGEAYYAPPGHLFEALEDTETVEFSPKEELEKTQEVIGKNIEAMMEEGPSS